MRLRIASLSLALLLIPIVFLSAQASVSIRRFALVIGNSNYTSMPKLKNPVNDATDLDAALEDLGFKVTLLTDASRKQMNQAIVALREALAEDRQSEGVFFFAGHGIQSKGMNYLIPVGADIQAEVDLEDEAVSAQKILGSLEEARNRVNLVILDACRDNPLPSKLRGTARGLAVVTSAPPETLILYSTGAGQTAADGEGRNSPFAEALLAHIADTGDVTQMVKTITGEVKKATEGQQTPYVYMGLSVDFMLNPERSGAESASSPPSVQQPATKLRIQKTYGSITIDTVTSGTLLIDGESQGAIPAGGRATLQNVETGSHVLLMKYDDGGEESYSIAVTKGKTAAIVFSQVGALPDRSSVPTAAIKIDGNFEDWKDVQPAFIMRNPWKGSLKIDKVYLAKDSENLYMRFDIKDDTKSSFFHPHNFDISHRYPNYGIDIWNRDKQINLAVIFNSDPNTSRWFINISKWENGQSANISYREGDYNMKGSSVEAKFGLNTIKNYLGQLAPGDIYYVHARTGYEDSPGRWHMADISPDKALIF